MSKPLTSEALFDALAARLGGQADLQITITAHVREVTKCNTLFAFQQSDIPEEQKIAVWKECMAAIVNKTTDKLKGTVAKGQAAEPPKEQPKEAPKEKEQPKAKDEPKSSDMEQLSELLKRMLGANQPTASAPLDEFKLRALVQPIVDAKVAEAFANFLESFKPPPRDVVEIRKWDGTVKEIGPLVHAQFKSVMQYVTARNAAGYPIPLWLYGSPGSGKTHMGGQMAEAIGVKYYPFSFGPTTTEGRLIGFNSLSAGAYVAGLLYEPFKNGGLFLGDEIDSADPGVPIALNSINSNYEYMFPSGELVKRHRDFYSVMCGNTKGTGSKDGFVRNKLDAATLDRPAYFELKYDEDLEVKLCGNEPWARYVQKVRAYAANNSAASLLITPRCSLNGAALLANGVESKQVEDSTVYKLCSPDIKKNILASVGHYSGWYPNNP